MFNLIIDNMIVYISIHYLKNKYYSSILCEILEVKTDK
jgi:hypothetical protein